MRLITSLILSCILTIIFSSCRTSTKTDDKHLNINYIDTTIVLLNVDTLNKTELADIIRFLSDKNVSLIALNFNFEENDKSDSILINQIKTTRSKIVASCDLKLSKVDSNSYYKFLEFGPAVLYMDNKDIVTSFSFLYETENNKMVESFYLKILKSIKPAIYDKYHTDSNIYKINFLGNRHSFLNVHHSQLNNTTNSAWRDKIVLVGYLGPKITTMFLTDDDVDAFFTPTSRWNVPKNEPNMYGTVITANIISAFINSKDK
jgi:hypothetical protein